MKQWKKAVVAAAVMAVAWAGAASGDVGLGVMAGYWDAGDVADDFTGFGGGVLKVEADLLPMLGVEARLGVWGMSDEFDGRNADGEWREWDIEASVVSAEAGLVGKLPLGLVALYGGGGVGAYYMDGEVKGWGGRWRRDRYDLDCDAEVGSYAFGGLEIALAPNIALVGEVRYTWLEVEPGLKDHGWKISGKETIDLDGFGAEIGVMFWL